MDVSVYDIFLCNVSVFQELTLCTTHKRTGPSRLGLMSENIYGKKCFFRCFCASRQLVDFQGPKHVSICTAANFERAGRQRGAPHRHTPWRQAQAEALQMFVIVGTDSRIRDGGEQVSCLPARTTGSLQPWQGHVVGMRMSARALCPCSSIAIQG